MHYINYEMQDTLSKTGGVGGGGWGGVRESPLESMG